MNRPVQRSAAALAACVAAALLATAWLAGPAWAKSYVFERVVIDASVGRDGSLRVVEARTYRFDGEFSWATYRLPLKGTSAIRTIRVADAKQTYRLDGSLAPGTYLVTRDGDAALIRWGFTARDESKTFTISYVLDDVVTVYDDVAELYWKFVGTGWDVPSEEVRVTVRLPGGLRQDQIRAWAHGPLHGDVRPVDGGAVLAVRALPASTMVEGRLAFPREAVPQARNRQSGAGLPRILKEEEAWAARANRLRVFARAALYGTAALPIVVIAGWLLLYLRFGREPDSTVPDEYYRELPATYAPAELGYLWRFGAVQPADFVATLLDLTRRGYLAIEVGEREGFLGIGGEETYTLIRTDRSGGLQAFESDALDILFGRVDATGERVTIGRRSGLPPEVKRRVGRRFSGWKGKVHEAAQPDAFFDKTSQRVSTLSYVAGGLLLFLGWFGGIALEHWLALAATVGSAIVLFFGGGALRRRSQRGADDLRRWQGFRRFLLDFSEMPRAELPALTLWEHYLVYAVPLGVADRVIKQLGKVYSPEELSRSSGLRVWSTGSASGRGGFGLAALSGFTTAVAAATSSASSGSGRGGGLSGGGGGGGGGSGGSAG
ncbi:MAG: DUF2207 domain-containing protein [Armatimonadota bacterium]|nr:DUF2207 domain-containing protein [Armatimonadota bacterium]